MKKKRTKAETEELAEKVARALKWYIKDKRRNSPSSERQEKISKDRLYKILEDDVQMTKKEITKFMMTIVLKFLSEKVDTITSTSIKRLFESD